MIVGRFHFYSSKNLPKLALANPEILDKFNIKFDVNRHAEIVSDIYPKIKESIDTFFKELNLTEGIDFTFIGDFIMPKDFETVLFAGFYIGLTYEVLDTKKFLKAMNIYDNLLPETFVLPKFTVTISSDGILNINGIKNKELSNDIEDFLLLNNAGPHSKFCEETIGRKPYIQYALELIKPSYEKYKKLRKNISEFFVYSTPSRISFDIINLEHDMIEFKDFLIQLERAKLKRKLSLDLNKQPGKTEVQKV